MEPNPQDTSPPSPNQNSTPNPPGQPSEPPVITPTNPVPPTTSAPVAPTASVTPIPTQPTGPSIFVGDQGSSSETPLQPLQPFSTLPKTRRSIPKKPLLAGLVVLLVAGSAAAYQFGYKTNPSLVYSQSLSNTGKGYAALVGYLDKQSGTDYVGVTGSGDYKFKAGSTSTDGSFKFQSDGEDSLTTMDIGLGVSRANLEVRSIKSKGTSPDYYLKASGITGLDSLVGAEAGAAAAKLNDKWIAIDHTLIDNFSQQLSADGKGDMGTPPSKDQILDEIHAFGKVNQEYVFSSGDKAVLQRVGDAKAETVEGHKTIHYKVSLVKANAKKYVTAQHDALLASKLGDWIKKNKYEDSVKSTYEETLKSTDSIKESDTFDLWADVNSRLVYKIRVSDTASKTDYSEFGLDYKGGDEYPFFIGGVAKDSDMNVRFVLNSKTNKVNGSLSFKSKGEATEQFSGNFTFKPTDKRPQVDAPTGAISLGEAMQLVGLGDLYEAYSDPSNFSALSSGGQGTATDTKRKTDISALQGQLEVYYADNGNYPSFAQLNSAAWRSANMASLDPNALQDPDGSSSQLVTTTQPHAYAYNVGTDGGKSCESAAAQCTVYSITAVLSDGSTYAKTSLN